MPVIPTDLNQIIAGRFGVMTDKHSDAFSFCSKLTTNRNGRGVYRSSELLIGARKIGRGTKRIKCLNLCNLGAWLFSDCCIKPSSDAIAPH